MLLKTTTSVCSRCLESVPASVFRRGNEVFLEKSCPTHGSESALLASDSRHYYHDHGNASACGPSKSKGACCGTQHSCTLIFEITESCNLSCPTCFAGSSPQMTRTMSFEQFCEKLDRLRANGKESADLVQLSGGEPTIHPDVERMVDYAFAQGVQKLYINTNGIRLGSDPGFAERLGRYAGRLQFYLQFDGFRPETYGAIRGAKGLLNVKLRALENATNHGLFVLPVMTVTRDVNLDEIGPLIRLVLEHHPRANTVMLQPAMYAGRYANEKPSRRLTVAEVAAEVEQQTNGMFSQADFGPIPCSDPNCFSIAVGVVRNRRVIPVSRYFPSFESWSTPGVADRIARFTDKMPQNMVDTLGDDELVDQLLDLLTSDDEEMRFNDFRDFLLICVKPFMDAECYDQDRVDRCCVHIVDRAGEPMSLCEYNTLRRPKGLL